MSSRFEDRLRSGPPIVADGGMGALISGAVPRLRCPEEANLRAPGERRRAARELHPRRRRADRDEHVRRQPAQARGALPRGRASSGSTRAAVRLAREAREVSGADVFIAGSIGPIGEVERFDLAEQSQRVQRAGADPRGPRRRPAHARDVLRPRRARRRDRGRPQRLVAPDRRADDVRRRRPDARRRLRRDGGRAARRARRRRRGGEPQRRPGGGAERARRDAARRARARRAPERRPREPRRHRASSSRTRRRTTSPSSRRRRGGSAPASSAAAAARRRHRSRRSATAIEEDRAPAAPLVVRERELADAAEAAPEETGLARMLREQEFVVSVQLDPPLGANNSALVEAGRALQRVRQGALRRRQRQPARAGADERRSWPRSRSSAPAGSRRSRT